MRILFATILACAGFILAAGPTVLGVPGVPVHRPSPRPRAPLIVARNPFVPPARYRAEEKQAQAKTAVVARVSSGNSLAQPPASILLFAGKTPFALVPGRVQPLYEGDAYMGSTIREIAPLGIILADGRVISAGPAPASFISRSTGAVVPAVFPTATSAVPYSEATAAITPSPAPSIPYGGRMLPQTTPYGSNTTQLTTPQPKNKRV
ncbi:MAG: hypothetical protein ACYDGM_07910 [Vulcanimicrobiaceae bacterium]